MKRIVPITALAMVAAWLPAHAQPGPPANTAIAASAVADASGGSILARNTAAVAVTAFVYIYTMRNADAGVLYAATGYYDSATDPQTQPPIKPGQEVRVPHRIPFSGATPMVGAEAGLFADGGSFGEPNVVRSIFERRNYTLVSLNKSIADLKEAAKDGLSRQDADRPVPELPHVGGLQRGRQRIGQLHPNGAGPGDGGPVHRVEASRRLAHPRARIDPIADRRAQSTARGAAGRSAKVGPRTTQFLCVRTKINRKQRT